MPVFRYQAKTSEGADASGSLEAPAASAAAALLRERGLFIIKLEQAKEGHNVSVRKDLPIESAYPLVGVKQRLEFWRQLLSATNSGMSISEALGMIAGPGTPRGRLGKILAEAAVRTAQGEALSDVLSEYPAAFPRAECALVRAGESSGTLTESVQALAEMNEQELELRRVFMFQSAQPVLTLVVAVFVYALVRGGPGGFGAVLRSSVLPIGLLVVLAFFGLRGLLARVPPVKLSWDLIKLKTPGIGAITTRIASAKAASILAAGYRSGLDVASSVELAAESCGNTALASRFRRAVPEVQRGESLATALARANALPPRALQFLQTGERTGSVDSMMRSMSGYFRDEAVAAIKISAIVLGVLLLIAAAAVVLSIAAGFYGGMYRGMMRGI